MGVLVHDASPLVGTRLVLMTTSTRYIDDGDPQGGFTSSDVADLLGMMERGHPLQGGEGRQARHQGRVRRFRVLRPSGLRVAGYWVYMVQAKPAGNTTRPPGPVRVTMADECELVTQGIASLLAPYDALTLVPRAPGGGLATFVDVTLHDTFTDLPLSESTLARLVGRPAGGRLVVYTWNLQQELVNVALAHGAAGCLSKCLPGAQLADALLLIAAGETVVRGARGESSAELVQVGLTRRETEVVSLIAAGLSNQEIALSTGLSINSIKSYIRAAYRKIQVTTRSQAVLWAVRHGCVTERSADRVAALQDERSDDLVRKTGYPA